MLDNLNVQNKDTYENKVKELTNKNKEKENLHKGLESKKELFSPTLQQKIKQQLVNEDEKTKYDALAQQYTELASTKEQIKQKINSLEWLGAKDKESLTKKLINQENASTSRAIETEANQLNTFKKNLTDSVQQLQNIDQSEKTTTKDRIKEAITKDQAQKLHDDLKLKSQKADAKNQVNSLNNINNRKQGYLNEIESASNESKISAIVNRAKNRSNLNKEKETAKNQIQNLNLISNEHKQRLKNEIDSRETVDKVNETLNWAKQLSELKAQNSFDKLKLTNLSKNTNEKAKYEQELLNADTKVAVTRLVNDYKAKENEIVKANQKIDQHNNLSTEVKNSFKTKIREAQTNKINDIINEAKTLDTNNYRNITTLNGLQYLNDTYKTNKAKEIKNQATTQASNAKLKEAVDFNNSKKEYADKINQFSLLTQKTKTDAISGLKNNDNQSSYKEKYDKLKEKEDIKKERLTLITTTSEITRKGREILDSQLRATDEDHELNRILEDVVMWRNEAKINSDITSSLNSSKAKIQELAASNQANSSQSLQSLNNFISQNTKNEEDTLDALKVKNKALKDGLRERIIKFNQSMSTKVDNTNTNASKPLNTINNDELTNTKNKLEADIEKYKSIKQSISSNFDQSFDQNGYDNVIAKSTQVLAKLNQKIQLVDKYQTINKTLLSSKLAEREKEWLESRLLKVARNPDVQMSELDGVQNDINNAINEQKRLLDAFADAEFDLNKTMDVLKDIDAISKNRQINASHQSIVQKYNNIMTTIKSRYDDSVNEGTLPQLTSEVTKLNDGLEIYATKFTEVKNYIIKHSGTEQIQTDAWDQYEKSTQNVRLELSKDGIKDYGYYKQTMETTLNSAFDDVKKLVFKKQIVEFIGNGRWSQPGQVSYNSHVNFTISNAYVENPSAKSKAQIKFVENKGYETTYPNMHINFNISDVTNGYTGGHDIWTHEIYFHSSDDDKMVYRLQSKRYKQHTWFVINKMPSSTKYDRRLDPWAYKVDNDKKNWFTEEDLVLTEFKGQKVK
ncbi:hypothetical protein JM47_02455 [Ureaplasma diversum]|uniref:Extracellular matrix-binding protein ebh GA module domain-containing protein n=1 Tax=Ureaplasma diversum TaxID=42094 RepID=A0A0C5RPX5_9BACT|nr:GA module-containing protein [Ureaplasma diversum]AJQ45424.1 hypothetical protein JM47_02455 [Ureaplasma diversum]